MIFARFVSSLPSYQVIYCWPCSDLFCLWFISTTWDLSFFFSCLGSLRCHFYSFLQLFVTFLFLIVVDQWLISYSLLPLIRWCCILFLFPARLLVLFLCNRYLFRLFHIRLLFLTKLLFSAVMLWDHRLNSTGSQVVGLSVVVTLCSWIYCYIAR